MTITETAKLLKLLNAEYPNEPISADRTELWQDALKHADYAELRAAVSTWIGDAESSKWFPKPGQLKALCKRTGARPTMDEDPSMISQYFALTEKYQREALDGDEERELQRLESALGVPPVGRCIVQFDQPAATS